MIESDVSIYLMMRPRAWVIIGLLSILCCGIISRDETIQLAKVPRDAELGLSTTNVTAIVICFNCVAYEGMEKVATALSGVSKATKKLRGSLSRKGKSKE